MGTDWEKMMELILAVVLALILWAVISAWLIVVVFKFVGPLFARLVDKTEAWYMGRDK